MKNPLNNHQRLKILLNDAKFFLLLISTMYVLAELVRWGLSKNGDSTNKPGRKSEVSPESGAH